MADQFTRFLTGLGQGLTNPKGNLGDFRHASRLYLDNQYARAPRTKFLYHVNFEINRPALNSPTFNISAGSIGMLVKQADLPKVTLDHDIKNQYNRKKVIYKDLKYEPLNITFHDDSFGLVNAMWAQYLSFYSPERFQPQQAWQDTSSGPYGPVNSNKLYRYGLDVSKGVSAGPATEGHAYTQPFFKNITLYTLSKKRFNSYTLVNPHIVSWTHGNVDQSSNNGTVEAQMSIVYESILYGTGIIVKNKEPTNFANVIYDSTPSPLTIGGGTIGSVSGLANTLLGQTFSGIINDAEAIYGPGNVQQGRFGSGGNLLQNTVAAINFYKSVRSISKESLIAEATNIILSPQQGTNAVSGIAGVQIGVRN